MSEAILPRIAEFEASAMFPRRLIRDMGDGGLFGAAFPVSVGGSALGFLATALISEEVSRIAPEFGYAMNLQSMTCPYTIFNWGTPEQVERFVPPLIAGENVGMFALTEPAGGSDAAGSMKTVARREGNRYVLSGSKQWITFANACDTGVLFAKTDPAAGHRGITAFIVEPKSAPGFVAEPIAMAGLSRCLATCAVYLDGFEVPAENRLGQEGEGFTIAMNALEYGRLTVSARLVGLIQACLDAATRYANERVVRGSPLGRYQMVQHAIADMTVNVEAARLLTYRTAWTMDEGKPANRAASQSKYFASLAAKHAAQAAADIFGGYALSLEYPIAKMTAYINMLNMGEGAANVQRILIAEDRLGYKDANRHGTRNRGSRHR